MCPCFVQEAARVSVLQRCQEEMKSLKVSKNGRVAQLQHFIWGGQEGAEYFERGANKNRVEGYHR